MANPYGGFRDAATNYAAGSAAPVSKTGEALRSMLASYISPEALTEQVSGFFAPALQEAGMVGEKAGAAGAQLAGTLSSLAGSLPGMDPNAVNLMLRSTARAGGSAQLMGSALTQQAQLAQAMATQSALKRREDETKDLTLQALAKEEEAGRIAADTLTPAAMMSDMATQQLQRKALQQEIKRMPMQDRAMRLDMALKRGEIGMQRLESLAMRKEISREFGIPLKDINAMWRRTKITGEQSEKFKI